MSLGMLGKKLGMTQLFDKEGNAVSATVLQVGPCRVVQRRKATPDGYDAVQIGFAEVKKVGRLTKAMTGHFKKQGVSPYRHLGEFRVKADSKLDSGHELTVASFKEGDLLHVTGISKGKGFAGVIKRHHKSGGPAAHGSRFHRTTGSIGQRTSPGETFKNMKLPGHMGDRRVTVKNLPVVRIEAKANIIFVAGAVPGARGGLLRIVNVAPDIETRGVA